MSLEETPLRESKTKSFNHLDKLGIAVEVKLFLGLRYKSEFNGRFKFEIANQKEFFFHGFKFTEFIGNLLELSTGAVNLRRSCFAVGFHSQGDFKVEIFSTENLAQLFRSFNVAFMEL